MASQQEQKATGDIVIGEKSASEYTKENKVLIFILNNKRDDRVSRNENSKLLRDQ
jgi:hypothetical protein